MTSYRMLQLKWFFQRLLNRILGRKYWLSFIEEYWQGQKPNTWIGRIEYLEGKGDEATGELGIATFNVDGVEEMREKYDFKDVTEKEFLKVQQLVAELNKEKK